MSADSPLNAPPPRLAGPGGGGLTLDAHPWGGKLYAQVFDRAAKRDVLQGQFCVGRFVTHRVGSRNCSGGVEGLAAGYLSGAWTARDLRAHEHASERLAVLGDPVEPVHLLGDRITHAALERCGGLRIAIDRRAKAGGRDRGGSLGDLEVLAYLAQDRCGARRGHRGWGRPLAPGFAGMCRLRAIRMASRHVGPPAPGDRCRA
jgi:hypothetical protein